LKYQNFATSSGHILIPFIIGIGAGWGTDTRILLQTFLVGMRHHFGDTERGTEIMQIGFEHNMDHAMPKSAEALFTNGIPAPGNCLENFN